MRWFHFSLGIIGGVFISLGSQIDIPIWRTILLLIGGFCIGFATQ